MYEDPMSAYIQDEIIKKNKNNYFGYHTIKTLTSQCIHVIIITVHASIIAKRAGDVMTQTRLGQTNWNGFFNGKSRCS